MMSSSNVSPAPASQSSSRLAKREFLVRLRLLGSTVNERDKVIALRIFDDQHNASEEILLESTLRQPQGSDKNDVDVFLIRSDSKLSDRIRRLHLHTNYLASSRRAQDKNDRTFLHWIELVDQTTKRMFCFPVDDYLPASSGDALELTTVHQDRSCEATSRTALEDQRRQASTTNDGSLSTVDKSDLSRVKATRERSGIHPSSVQTALAPKASGYARLYDVRTETGHQGFLGIKSLMKARVFLKLHDVHGQFSEIFLLSESRLHKKPFRSNQTDQFQVGTSLQLGPLTKVEMWHDGAKGVQLHCDTLEITDLTNGRIYCFRIKGR